MATTLTDTGVEFPGNGATPVEQSKAIKNVEGNEADSTGKITLSSVSGKTLDERITEIEQLGSGGGAVYLEQNTFGTNNYMFKDSYWWGGESVYSYSSANATEQTAIENLERGNVLNLSAPNSSEYYHVSSVDSANKRITLIRGTFNDRSSQNLTIDDAENGTFSNVTFTHFSNVAPAVTTGSWLQIEAGSNYSGSTISTTNGIGFAPMNLSTLPSEATHILFRVTSETSGHLIIYNREHFLTRSSSAPILESEKVHQVDVESSGSQSSSDEFWVPNNSFLQFWLTGSGTAHLYPVAYAVMDLSKVNLDGASIPAVNALSGEIIDLQNQVNSNNADILVLQTDVLDLQEGGGGGVSSLNTKTGDLTVSAGTGISVTLTSSPNGLQISNSGVTSVNGSSGAVNLSNTYYTQNQVDNLISSSGGAFTTQKVFTTSTNWTVPAGVDKVKIYVTGGGGSASYQSIYDRVYQASAGSTVIGVFSVTGGTSILTITVGAGAPQSYSPTSIVAGGDSKVTISTESGEIKAVGAPISNIEVPYNTMTGIIGDVIILNPVRGSVFKGQLTTDAVIEGCVSYWGSGSPPPYYAPNPFSEEYGFGGRFESLISNRAGDGVVVIEY